LPAYRTSSSSLAKAAGAGLAVALLTAVLWRFFPEWQFYLCLILGFGTVEAMARFSGNKRGADLQLLAVLLVTLGLGLARVLLAQRFGISLGEVNALDETVRGNEIISAFDQRSMPVSEALQLRLVPDVVYAAMAYAIAWIRFR
jgi:hypothetical protein